MELKIKFLRWSTGSPVALLNEKTAKKLGINSLDRISLKTVYPPLREISTIVNTISEFVNENEIAVSSELKEILGLKKGQKVTVNLNSAPQGARHIKKKIDKKKLNKKEIYEIIKDITSNSLSESEIALFISSMYEHGMTLKETIYLIEAMLKTGSQLKIKNKVIVEKHSIGGVPGNRTTPIVVSICASKGLIVPKTSSRAITSPAGTADVIEAIARVDFSMKEIKKIIDKTNACIVWGGGLGMVPADAKIIKIEKILNMDPKAQLIASIMSKKLAMGSKYILIDIPYGKGAKVTKKEARDLARQFRKLGKHFNKNIKCVLTDGSQPIGNGVGPILELKDIVRVLKPDEESPKDLEKKAIFLSGKLLELSGKVKKGKGKMMAEEILYSGKAFEKFKEIIKAQEGSLGRIRCAKLKKEIFSKKSGKIIRIDNKKINSLARVAGCPNDKRAGLYLYSHVGNQVRKGDKILTIYSESEYRLKEAISFYDKTHPISIT